MIESIPAVALRDIGLPLHTSPDASPNSSYCDHSSVSRSPGGQDDLLATQGTQEPSLQAIMAVLQTPQAEEQKHYAQEVGTATVKSVMIYNHQLTLMQSSIEDLENCQRLNNLRVL
ncbi:hypothetical protein NDU88_001395 [Pleurodeles waltl]|uniref:Uncharacterized protein n=1 Tax=Pleurodeles waltl TaxID=8319 RepID=A0AAV7UVZ8_PLEWA|nr:hypothetical protein NDU88_001395 [Pleurodeles waltl]